jgi:hypothetical protein
VVATNGGARRVLANTSVSRKTLASVSVAVVAGVTVGVVGVLSLDSAADAAEASYLQSTRALVEIEEARAQFL